MNLKLLIPCLGIVIGGLGCSRPGPEQVYVNLARVSRAPAPRQIAPESDWVASVPSDSLSLPAQSARELYLGESAGRVASSMAHLRENRQKAIEELRETARKDFEASVRNEFEQRRSALTLQQKEDIEAAFHKAFSEFEANAVKRGKVVWKLAGKAGFPDKSPAATDFERRRNAAFPPNAQQVADLRSQIIEMDLQFDQARRTALRSLDQDMVSQKLALEAAFTSAQAVAKRKAEEHVNALLQAEPEGTQVTFLPNRHRADAVGGSSAQLPSASSRMQGVPAPESEIGQSQQNWTQGQLKAWASSHNYIVVSRPAHVRDATGEFLEWRKKLKVGP